MYSEGRYDEFFLKEEYSDLVHRLYNYVGRSIEWLDEDVAEKQLLHCWGRDGVEYLWLQYYDPHVLNYAVRLRHGNITDPSRDESYLDPWKRIHNWMEIADVGDWQLCDLLSIPHELFEAMECGDVPFHSWEEHLMVDILRQSIEQRCDCGTKLTFSEEGAYDLEYPPILYTKSDIKRVFSKGSFTASFFRPWRKGAGLSTEEAADMFKVPLWLWQKWEGGARIPALWVEKRILQILQELTRKRIEKNVQREIAKKKIRLGDKSFLAWSIPRADVFDWVDPPVQIPWSFQECLDLFRENTDEEMWILDDVYDYGDDEPAEPRPQFDNTYFGTYGVFTLNDKEYEIEGIEIDGKLVTVSQDLIIQPVIGLPPKYPIAEDLFFGTDIEEGIPEDPFEA